MSWTREDRATVSGVAWAGSLCLLLSWTLFHGQQFSRTGSGVIGWGGDTEAADGTNGVGVSCLRYLNGPCLPEIPDPAEIAAVVFLALAYVAIAYSLYGLSLTWLWESFLSLFGGDQPKVPDFEAEVVGSFADGAVTKAMAASFLSVGCTLVSMLAGGFDNFNPVNDNTFEDVLYNRTAEIHKTADNTYTPYTWVNRGILVAYSPNWKTNIQNYPDVFTGFLFIIIALVMGFVALAAWAASYYNVDIDRITYRIRFWSVGFILLYFLASWVAVFCTNFNVMQQLTSPGPGGNGPNADAGSDLGQNTQMFSFAVPGTLFFAFATFFYTFEVWYLWYGKLPNTFLVSV